MPSTSLPGLPEEFPHIFTGVAFEVVPEVNYADLCYLSQIAKAKGHGRRYRSLVEALRKIQWAKLAGLEALAIEREIEKEIDRSGEDVLLQEPVGQVQHAKATFDFAAHAKAALDSIAVFLTDYFAVDARGGDRDFRRAAFREKIQRSDNVIGQHIASLQSWLDSGSRSLDSLIAVRDEWLHRFSPATALVLPRSELGLLPVPRQGLSERELREAPVASGDYWSTQQFTRVHFDRLVELFGLIVKRCIELELGTLAEPPAHLETSGQPICAVPVRVTETKTFSKTALGQRTRVFYGSGGSTP
jgi:hypothetical protein